MLDILIKVGGVMVPIFWVLGLGAYFAHTKMLSPQGNDNIKSMVTNVLMPIMIFNYLIQNPLPMEQSLDFIVGAFAFATFMAIVFYIIVWRWIYKNPRLAVFSTASFIFPNNIYLGIPICVYAFGDGAMLPAIIFGVTFFTLPFYILTAVHMTNPENQGSPALKIWKGFLGAVKNPIVGGVILSIFWIQLDIQTPDIIARSLNIVSDANKMLALLTIGTSLYFIYHDKAPLNEGTHVPFRLEITLAVLMKLIGMPLIALGFVSYFDFPPIWKAVFVLQSATPFGILVYFLASSEKIFVRQAAVHVLVSTFVSIVTLPIFIVFLWGYFGV